MRRIVKSKLKKTTIVTIAIIAILSSVTVYAKSELNKRATRDEIHESVKKDIESYMSKYATFDDVKTDILQQNGINEATGTNTSFMNAEQIEKISDTVMSSVKLDLLKDLSKKNSISQDTIDELEATIISDINTLLASQPSPTMSKEEKELLTNTIVAFTEAEIMNHVNSKYTISDENMKVLKNSVNSKMSQIESSINDYNKKFSEIQEDIDDVVEKMATSDNTTNLKNELTALSAKLASLTVEYEAFASNTLQANKVIDDINTEISKQKELLEGKISGVHSMLKENIDETDNDVDELKNELASTSESIDKEMALRIQNLKEETEKYADTIEQTLNVTISATKGTLKDLIDGNVEDTAEVLDKLNKSKEEINAAMENSDSETKKSLSELLKQIELAEGNMNKALESYDEAQAQALSAKAAELNSAILDSKLEISDTLAETSNSLNELISGNKTNVTTLFTNLGKSKSELEAQLAYADGDKKDIIQALITQIELTENSMNSVISDEEVARNTAIQEQAKMLTNNLDATNTTLEKQRVQLEGKITNLQNSLEGSLSTKVGQLTASIKATDDVAQDAKTKLASLASDMDAKLNTADEAVLNAKSYALRASEKAEVATTQATKTGQDLIKTNSDVVTTTNKANFASEKAEIAENNAEKATTMANSASNSAEVATGKLGEVTTKANNAATSASTAGTKANEAKNSANAAATSATQAANAAKKAVEEEMDGVMKGTLSSENGIPTLNITVK